MSVASESTKVVKSAEANNDSKWHYVPKVKKPASKSRYKATETYTRSAFVTTRLVAVEQFD